MPLYKYYKAAVLLVLLAACGRTAKNYAPQEITLAKVQAIPPEKQNALPPASDTSKMNTEEYDAIAENPFLHAGQNPLSTFSIDVDKASYSNVRRFINDGIAPPPGAVRIEEMINYFDYEYAPPAGDEPFAVHTEVAACPWNTKHQLVHIGLKGKEIKTASLPPSNLVFLIDVSGSMNQENKLPLVKESLTLLIKNLREQDKVAIVTYARNAGLVLPSTAGTEKQKISKAIESLDAGGSTAGAAGIELAYQIAEKNFIKDGNNRVILATDGDFNVGPSSDDELVTLIEQKRKSNIFLSVLGYGTGNYQDSKMQQLADKGNGNHFYIDNLNEAKKVLLNEFGGTLFTIAKDVKIQVEFNPANVQAYRLIGYENRILQNQDFTDDKKDAGELGAGHTVTALYEIIPAGIKDEFVTDEIKLKYQQPKEHTYANTNEIMTVKLRYKQPDSDISKLLAHTVAKSALSFSEASENFRFSSAVAGFGLLLRNSAYKQNLGYAKILEWANASVGKDENGYRKEFIELVQKSEGMALAKK